jgi:nucleoside-diphosphate-sugar epimerase
MSRVFVAGGAGLVGQNIIPRLIDRGFEVAAVDKHAANARVLAELNPKARVITADMAEPGPWEPELGASDVLVMLQAQIGGLDPAPFERNNITSTRRALEAAASGSCGYVAHVSSSVVNSAAVDLYTESKKAQEALLAGCATPHIVLRPTLMFGWFDRKHLGWLRRFMDRSPLFPIPGNGRYLRQPLYAGDFAAMLAASIDRRLTGAYNISGLQQIDYVDLIGAIRKVTGSRSAIVSIPAPLFAALLEAYALFDRNPPFTVAQLKALMTPDVFEVIDWPGIFGVTATPLEQALAETFLDPRFGRVTLEF